MQRIQKKKYALLSDLNSKLRSVTTLALSNRHCSFSSAEKFILKYSVLLNLIRNFWRNTKGHARVKSHRNWSADRHGIVTGHICKLHVYNVLITNEMHNFYNQFLFQFFVCCTCFELI